MFSWRDEGATLKYGFNFYKPNDPQSAGFILKLHPRFAFWFRYSKKTKKWFIGPQVLSKLHRFISVHYNKTGEFLTEAEARKMMNT